MSEAATEVPILGIGREQTQAWTQAVLAIASALRQRRLEKGRLAWSEERETSRRAERLARLADPPVRTMTEAERRSWEFRRVGDQSLGVGPAQDMETRRSSAESGSWVEATVGPLAADAPAGAWGLTVNAFDAAVTDGEQLASTTVRCADELTAKRLADDLLARGTDAVERLHGFAVLASQRAESAASEVTEPEELRLARTEAAVREAWSDYAGLADQAIIPTPAQQAKGEQWNPAFGALAWRLHEMEDRGYAMVDVLRAIAVDRLAESDVRNVAAFAEYMVEELMPELPIVDLGPVLAAGQEPGFGAARDGTEHGSDRAAGRRRGGSGMADERWPGQNARSAEKQEGAIAPLLAGALPEDVLERVRESRYYPQLREDLYIRHERGRNVAELLARLPVEKISQAGDPAAYLRAIVARRSEQRHMPAKTGVDRSSMAELLERGFPRELVDRVVASPRWPGLARRLAEWNSEQLPVQAMLETLSHDWIMTREDPAECTLRLMNSRAATERARRDSSPESGPESGDTIEAPGQVVETPRDHTTTPAEPAPAADEVTTAAQPTSEGQRTATERRHGGGPGAGEDSERSRTGFDVRWTDELDERSAVDRIGMEAAIGLGSAEDDARLDDRLRRGATPIGATSTTRARDGAVDGAEEAGHRVAADTAQARAGDHELDAAQHRAAVDVPGTEEREDHAGLDAAGADEHLAAADRAVAAEERGAASAAAARAEVTLTPDAAATAAQRQRGRDTAAGRPGGQRPVRAPRLDPKRGRQR